MKPEDFDLFAMIVKQRSGLILTADKAYLLESRLVNVARRHSMKSLEDMAQALRAKREESLMADVTEAMTTNETMFFRDRKPFTYFRETLLPKLIATHEAKKKIRIWSAACSSGQEPYSLAMICADQAEKLQGWKIEIIGSDLSREMITRAKSGIYTQFEVQRGLPIAYLVKYFQQVGGDKWQIKDHIRQMVHFQEDNLLPAPGVGGPFDVIFCRNVLTYFDQPTRTHVLESLGGLMLSESSLFLGGDENISGISDMFAAVPGQHSLHAPA